MSSFISPFAVLPTIGSPGDIIARADREITQANTFILKLGELTTGLTPPIITPIFPDGGSAPALSVPSLPVFSSATWVSPAAPSAFTGTLSITDLIPSAFTEAAPVLSFGTAPAAFTEAAPSSPAITTTFADPTLSLTLPTAPDLLSINVTPFSGLTLPTFTATDPVLSVVAPSIREYTPGAQYTSALLTQLKTTLLNRITNGGTGLSADVENALWDRARERDYRSQADQILELERMEILGYTFPSGVFLDARLRVVTESAASMVGTSREIMIKQAELEQSNVLAALQSSVQLEGTLISYTNSVEQRLFDATKYATEAGVAIYNAQVQAYQSLVEVFKTKVQIYEAQVRAEISKVDAYRAQIEAERAKAEVNTALVNQYKIKAEVAAYAIDIYKAEIAAIQTKAEIEKLKVEVFGEQIRAYGAKVNAYTAGVEGYRASLEAESTKQRVYASQVDAFSATVTAAAKQADIRIAAFKGLIDGKTIELDGYKAAIAAETARVNGIVSGNSTLTDAYKAQVGGLSSFNETLTKQWQVALDQAQQVATIGVSAAKANSEMYFTTRSLALDAAKVGAQVSAQLGAAALNAVNWSTSVSTSTSDGYSQSINISDSTSRSTSTSTNYNYSA